ncbi:MFS transporter [Actinopolyspora erythraea]|uniref:MFS transporter n=1 Tax=Actinopolyspora erythraea TaxID=414996 RepID=A0A223RZ81_9ACTN|nr:MFS transporter [Actinopolyspora erythraea]
MRQKNSGVTAGRQPWWITAALGSCVIAISYGLARYAYGLFVPQFALSFRIDGTGLGILGAMSTLGYALGLLAAPRTSMWSARGTLIGVCGLASAGMLLMSVSPNVVVFGAGLLFAGGSAGLTSPGLAQLVSDTIRPAIREQVQTWANAGTGWGWAVSAFTPMLVFGWRGVWLCFAVLALGMMVVGILAFPRGRPERREESETGAPVRTGWRPGMTAMLVNSVLLGLTSAPYLNFSRQAVREAGLSMPMSVWFWFCMGAAGLAGGLAGKAAQRYGLARANVGIWMLWAACIGMLAFPRLGAVAALSSATLFGAAFMALSGLCILWGARLYPNLAARGVTFSYLGLAFGQTVGSAAAGVLADFTNFSVVFAVTGLVSLLSWYQLIEPFGPPPPEAVPGDQAALPASTDRDGTAV